ncbi:D-alanine-D-alanyl carrier protein ligase [Bordetella ansorpii]|uniref:D-alanine-D-alanyl carrier protein ligase n=1 Tax=Bordetella ansorpii TaxID=288768 RepID=A0A157SW22_9BORD|nr:amino acid adenylation domain-containing protein [Bordetella ansorpii]SAI74505.1 D-alanine-D-alanyl carrier protein ligase [Bordetella ansorpii]
MQGNIVLKFALDASQSGGGPSTWRDALQAVVSRHEALGAGAPAWREAGGDCSPETLAAREAAEPLPHDCALRATWVQAAGRGCLLLAFDPERVDFTSAHIAALDLRRAASAQGLNAAQPAFQFGDYLAWCEGLADSADAQDGQAYWADYLARAAGLPGASVASSAQAARDTLIASQVSAHIDLSPDSTARLRAQAGHFGISPVQLQQAVWWLLLARLNGLQPYVCASMHDCRDDYDLMRDSVGRYPRPLPWVVDPACAPSVRAWLEGLRQTWEAHAAARECMPPDAPALHAARACGVAVLGQYGEAPDGALPAQVLHRPTEGCALLLQLREARPARVELYADAARYCAAALAALLDQFQVLLGDVLDDAGRPASDYRLLDPRQRAALLARDDRTGLSGDAPLLPWRLRHWAGQTPQAAALVQPDGQFLDYAGMHARAGDVAAWLIGQGVLPGSLVALRLPSTPALALAIAGVWRAAAAYVVLDPAWPQARLQAVLDDARPVLVLEEAQPPQAYAAWFPGSDRRAVMPARADGIAGDDPATAPDALAYVVYTSGSTGTPKGVAVTHGALANYARAATAAMGLEQCRRWGLASSLAADLGYTALAGAWHNGASIAFAQARDTLDGAAFSRFLRQARVDALKIVPSHLQALLEHASPTVPSTLVLGGEATPAALVRRIRAVAPACRIFNHYGPSETTVGVMVHEVGPEGAPDGILPLSTVLDGNRVRVLDARGEPTPAGSLGEVHIGGAQLCRGYLNGREPHAFVRDPFAPGAMLYRTGDLAHVLAGGGLRIAGRADHQVKVRGYRVEPGEVEAALRAQPGVAQAVVLAEPDADTGAALVAYVQPEAGVAGGGAQHSRLEHDLRAALPRSLPDYMLPVRYRFVADMPRLENGKIDRRGLAAAAAEAAPAVRAGEASADPIVRAVRETMATVLGRDHVGDDDDFFDMGGHSILVIKLVARLRNALRVEASPALVFDHPTARGLAAALRAQADSHEALAGEAQPC